MGKRPEILAPAGCLWRLKTAITFGADAVYVGGPKFGLRKNADNLSLDELRQGLAFAHERGAKVYVACNGMPLERDWPAFTSYADDLIAAGPDAVIVSDAGVCDYFHKNSDIRIHVSTQASVAHTAAAKMWKARGAKRVVLAREVTLDEARAIRHGADIEIEHFVHGAMCASYSGKCVISNYTAGRDANRGGCVQSCREVYSTVDVADGRDFQAMSMNAKDLMTLDLMPDFAAAGIDAAKIEGRMKSPLYVALAVGAYKAAAEGRSVDQAHAFALSQVGHRGLGQGALQGRMYAESIQHHESEGQGGVRSVGQVMAWDDARGAFIALKTPLALGANLSALTPSAEVVGISVEKIIEMSGKQLDKANPGRGIWVPSPTPIPPMSVAWEVAP